MKCIILAAGKGTRMGELTKSVPKPMLNINGKPKLAWSVENLPSEIDEVILVVGYLKEQIIDYFSESYDNRKITYVIQPEFNGTAGSIKLTKDLIKENESFLVIMGDDLYLKSDLEKLMKYDFAILVMKTEQAQNFGLVSIDDNQNLKNVVERPHDFKQGAVNTGAYMLRKKYFDVSMVKISETEYGLPQTIIKMTNDLGINVKVIKTKKWFPVGDPEALKKAQKILIDFI